MYQQEYFVIDPSPTIPTYVDADPYESSLSYYEPCQLLIRNNDRNDIFLSETRAIRDELNQIRSDIDEIKRRQGSPTYYITNQNESSNAACPQCMSCSSENQQTYYVQSPVNYYDGSRSFVQKPTYSVTRKATTKPPITTYQDSYRQPTSYSSFGHSKQRIMMNNRQTQLPIAAPVQHTRHWVPSGYKNTYPYRRWKLSVPHSEP